MVLLGFDPGGIKSFGWATLQLGEAGEFVSLTTGVASNAPEAVRNAGQSAASAPAGVGIDAPLFWGKRAVGVPIHMYASAWLQLVVMPAQ